FDDEIADLSRFTSGESPPMSIGLQPVFGGSSRRQKIGEQAVFDKRYTLGRNSLIVDPIIANQRFIADFRQGRIVVDGNAGGKHGPLHAIQKGAACSLTAAASNWTALFGEVGRQDACKHFRRSLTDEKSRSGVIGIEYGCGAQRRNVLRHLPD